MSGRPKLILQKALARSRWDIHRGIPLTIHREQLLRRIGDPIVLDVGANEGLYAVCLRTAGFRGEIHSFEPLPDAFQLLSGRALVDEKWYAVQAACGESVGTLAIHQSQNSVSSSILAMNETHAKAAPSSVFVGEPIECAVTTIDEYVAGHVNDSTPIYMKMDVQGFEDRVLRGAERSLSRIAAIESEISLTTLYEGQASWLELIGGLAEDFELVDVRPGFRDQQARLLQADVLLLRRGI